MSAYRNLGNFKDAMEWLQRNHVEQFGHALEPIGGDLPLECRICRDERIARAPKVQEEILETLKGIQAAISDLRDEVAGFRRDIDHRS